jgi:hypothetical protein
MYGLAWTHSNIGGQSKLGLSHQLLVVEAGVTKVALGSGIWTSGGIYAAQGGSFSADLNAPNFVLNSDSRLKQGVRPYNPKRLDITYREYEMIANPGVKRYGVIAQEVQKRYPELIRTDADGMLSVAYVDLLIREVAFLKERIEFLERRAL